MKPSDIPLFFLDIDGVMNTTGSCLRHRSGEVFDAGAVIALRWLLRRTGAKVVVTSTRRRAGLAAMRELFLRNDLADTAERMISLTPILTTHDTDEHREEEIIQWLEARNSLPRNYLIFDDKPFTGILTRRLILTDPDDGLTWELARHAVKQLSR